MMTNQLRNISFFLLSVVFVLSASGQEDSDTKRSTAAQKGIVWATGLSWKEVQAKAIQENKYIFIDAFATWCGPCKEMDKYVYSNDTIGRFFNDQFISVRVQMDQTKNDNGDIKEWYADAAALKKLFNIRAFPSYVFISPEGVTTSIDKGYKPVTKFLSIAKDAVMPGKVYVNPYAAYDKLMDDFENGQYRYDSMGYMFDIAFNKLRDNNAYTAIAKEYGSYLSKQKRKDLYKKDVLSFLGIVTTKSDSKWISLFYPDFEKTNRIMNDNNYAQKVIDKIIQREIVFPYLGLKGGGLMMGGVQKLDSSEAEWNELESMIMRKYNKYYADRNLLWAKVEWYTRKYNFKKLVESYFSFLEKYGQDSHERANYMWINHYAYTCFLYVEDKSVIGKAIKWIGEIVLFQHPQYSPYIDTYACLLYKTGKMKQAIEWEEKAIKYASEKGQVSQVKEFTKRYNAMREGGKI